MSKPKKGRWMEEYKHCGHSSVAVRKKDLLGYCRRCGTDRKYVIKLSSATEVGWA
jgi:hypothetical protein